MLLRRLYVLFCCLVLLMGANGGRGGTTSSCQEMIARATKQRKVFASPNFPNEFAEQTQCAWIVKAPSGYRVRISFKSFYLMGATMGCTRQKLRIVDLYTGMSDGPYCGNTLPPDAVSTGSGFRIILESNAVGVQDTYRGFQIIYHLTTAMPSERLRDVGGQWRNYLVTRNGFTLPPQTPPTPTRDPNEVDQNNNAAIDAVNNQVNKNANSKQVEIRSQKEQGVQIPDILDNGVPTRNKKRKPGSRVVYKSPTKRTKVTRKKWPKTPHPSEKSDKSKKDDSLQGGVVAGIVIAVIVALMLAFLIFYWICVKRKQGKTKGKERIRTSSPSSGSRYAAELSSIPGRTQSPYRNMELPRPPPPKYTEAVGRVKRPKPQRTDRPSVRAENRARTQRHHLPRGY